MIKIIEGNLFDTRAPVIAHQVNCQGVMGSGVARQVKEKFPKVYENYKAACQSGCKNLGKCLLLDRNGEEPEFKEQEATEFPYIANLFAQDTYGYDGRQYTDIEAFSEACVSLYTLAKTLGIDVIAMPYRIGCARGGASWSQIYMILESLFGKQIDVELWKLPEGVKDENLYV